MINKTLQNVFGFQELRKGQKDTIDIVMAGRSTMAIFPTGAGKSLCYQLPALHLPHLTLVISPLLALMKDQLEFLKSKGIKAATIDSTQGEDEVRQTMNDIKSGEIKILMVSVERLKNERFKNFISTIETSLLVVDEAHCISEWGHNFRPDYLKIPDITKELNIPQVLLLTATATPDVIEDVQKKFKIQPEDTTITGFHRPNLDISVIPCPSDDKIEALKEKVLSAKKEPTIVYVTLQKTAENIAEKLVASGVNAVPFHASLDIEVKEKTQLDFMNGNVDCIVATIAFGMGIDKSNIRNVIHYDLPSSIEGYAQEIGRAGRDGKPSKCILIGSKCGKTVLENFTYGATPEFESICEIVRDIYANGKVWESKIRTLSSTANIPMLTLKTLLVYLELCGVIEFKYSYASEYRFKFNKTKGEILSTGGENQASLNAIFAATTSARIWNKVDFIKLSIPRNVAAAVLMKLHESGDIFLESTQIIDSYSVLDNSEAPEILANRLYESFMTKEASDISRISNMVNFFESDTCLTSRLANYFGDYEAPQNCGHCSVCRGDVAELPSVELPEIDKAELSSWVSEIASLTSDKLTTLQISKILCGIHSPLVTRIKARKSTGFGQLQQYHFSDVLKYVEQVFG